MTKHVINQLVFPTEGLGSLSSGLGDCLEMAGHLMVTLGETVEVSQDAEPFKLVEHSLEDSLEMTSKLVVTMGR